MKKQLIAIVCVVFLICNIFNGCKDGKNNTESEKIVEKDKGVDYNTFCFYYNWYGNEEFDGSQVHWAHEITPNPQGGDNQNPGRIPGTDNNISSNYFPELGTYSNNDPKIIQKHMQMFLKARIGVLAVTWWNNRDLGKENISILLDEAAKVGIKICFHIEPIRNRNAQTTKENIEYIVDTYGNHPGFYKKDGKPLFFIYDSYLTPAEEWATLLEPDGNITIRNTPYDAIMIGLWVKSGEEDYFLKSGFDGFYTYFSSTGFVYGSTPSNWDHMQQWAKANNKLFIPSVGPGYIDERIRPWNTANTRDRNNGRYYDAMYKKAIDVKASSISITSFNEWHEGSQIEPAIPLKCDVFEYLDYGDLGADYYLDRTAFWVGEFQKNKQNQK